jgi:DNA-binding transcriptional regulator YhcF (GntR family)
MEVSTIMRIDLSLTRQAVFEVIQRRIETGERVSSETVALELNCHPNTVWRAIRDLRRAGVLQLVKRGNPYMPTQYRILADDQASQDGGQQGL